MPQAFNIEVAKELMKKLPGGSTQPLTVHLVGPDMPITCLMTLA